MFKYFISALFGLVLMSPAYAVDTAVAVATCGGSTLTAGFTYGITQDLTGTLCTAGGSGGTSYTVNYGSAIGTKGTPGGFKDGSGNFQSFIGSVANGLSVDCGALGNVLCGLLTTVNTNLTTVNTSINNSIPAGTNRIGYASDDPCASKIKTNLAISQNGASSVQLIALSGSTTIYVCSIMLISAGTTTVALTTGTGTACVTNNAAVIGTTTTSIANSMALVANSGWSLGSGSGTVALGVSASELCMILGTSVFVSGNLTYVQQ